MGDSITDKLRVAAEGLILADAQKHILAHRLARKLQNKKSGNITVSELLGMIDTAMSDMTAGIDLMVVAEDSYRDNRVVQKM
jgi:hypothetical protein